MTSLTSTIWSSTNAISFSSACTTKCFPSPGGPSMQFGKFKVEIILAWYRNSVYSVAMLPAPRSVAICLVLLFGVSSRLHAQASQSPSPIYYLIGHISARTPKGLLGFEMGTPVETGMESDYERPMQSRRASLRERQGKRARSTAGILSRSGGLACCASLRNCRRASRYRGKSEFSALVPRKRGRANYPDM